MEEETYDLVNPPAEALGPEDVPEEPPHVREPAQPGFLDHDLPCRHCGYNLRGMTEDKACPECGTAVGRSLLGDQLRFSNPDWVNTLAHGAGWVLWSVLLGIAAGILYGVVEVSQLFNANIAPVGPMAASLLGLYGMWLITMPEPGVLENTGMTLRGLVRWTAVFSTVLDLIGSALELIQPVAAMPVQLVNSLIGLVVFIALFVYARRLALRVPDYELAKQTKIVMWGFISLMLTFVLFGVLAVIIAAAGGEAAIFLAVIPLCAAGVAYLVFAIWALVLLFWYRRVAKSAAWEAETTWAGSQ